MSIATKQQPVPASNADGVAPRSRAFSVADVAERLGGVKLHLVLAWIKNGELRAIDIRAKLTTSKRPRWKILPEDLAAFLERRACKPTVQQPRRKAMPKQAAQEPLGRRW
jgi:hypothetical protein